ncbi:MAG: sigma-70 family RNA polymerase sigma factor [Oscillospiraceae bacterium]|nr:sigma-70 family RNA polymerase sigma factor [Oscillospiraceae bacterium]
MPENPLNLIIQTYYADILRYCNRKLGDHHAAEDCTQEVFLLLVKKADRLDLYKDIRPWLYAAADRIMKNYIRRNPPAEDMEDVPEPSEDFPYPESILDELEPPDRELLVAYFNADDHRQLARSLGISQAALYMRICRIKNKIRKNRDIH